MIYNFLFQLILLEEEKEENHDSGHDGGPNSGDNRDSESDEDEEFEEEAVTFRFKLGKLKRIHFRESKTNILRKRRHGVFELE